MRAWAASRTVDLGSVVGRSEVSELRRRGLVASEHELAGARVLLGPETLLNLITERLESDGKAQVST